MNESIKTNNTDIMSIYQKSENILSDTKHHRGFPTASLPCSGHNLVTKKLADWIPNI